MRFSKIAFLFAGQGAQFVGMGKDLAATSVAARELYSRADVLIGRNLSGLCFEGPLDQLTLSSNCQPAITVTSLACLAAFQEHIAVCPVACAGLSLGEFAALQAAGAVPFEDTVRLVAARGRFMEEACRATRGAMVAVLNTDEKLVLEKCRMAEVDIANYNCPGQIVISGEKENIQTAVDLLKAAGAGRIVPLQVDGAFHSRLMASAVPRFAVLLAPIAVKKTSVPVAQNISGKLESEPEVIRQNLVAQIAGSVRWEAGVRSMLTAGVDAFVEFGPGQVLAGFIRRIDRNFPVFNLSNAADLEKIKNDPQWK